MAPQRNGRASRRGDGNRDFFAILARMADLFALTAPLFLLVLTGFMLARYARWPKTASDALTRFVFSVAIPAYLFRLMSDLSRLPPTDPALLLAYFGGCLIVFLIARGAARFLFRLDSVSQSIFGLACIFSNNVMLGIPISRITLGEASTPAVSMIILFNALLLWTLVTISVEWARNRSASAKALVTTAMGVMKNPVIAAILAGFAFGLTAIRLPRFADDTLAMIGQATVPLSLIALGMGLAEYGVRAGWRESLAISALKLVMQPLVVFLLAWALSLPRTETQAIVLLAALPVGANVYMMSRQFDALGAPVSSSLVISTILASLTLPLLLALLGARA